LAHDPMQVLSKMLDFKALVKAVQDHPAGLVYLAAPGRDPKLSQAFFQRLGQASGRLAAAALVELAQGDRYEVGRAQLEGLSPKRQLEALDLALELAAPPNPGFSENRLRLLARQLGDVVPPRGALERILDHPHNPLVPLLLPIIAELSGAQDFYRLVAALPPARLQLLLERVDHCAAFPFACEAYLANQLESHPAQPLAQWARARRPQVCAPVTAASGKVRRLTSSEARHIATCPAAGLSHAVLPCLRAPCLGLTAALAQRPSPETPCLEVCLALLGCHDPLDQVDREFRNYSSPRAGFLNALEQRAGKQWLMNEGLPTHGHAWLSRWERHLGFLWSSLDHSSANLEAWLAWLAGAGPRLCEEGWGAVGRLLGMWRWRERELFASSATPALEHLAVEALTGAGGVGCAVCLDRIWDYQGGPSA
ncbi:MAG: hypothetical protein KC910_36520, partial [Candidatus Eremiobacteraeota bacterium]|nr:hypothetical protein [Candidatus Eremiobacteraeota bacterium]